MSGFFLRERERVVCDEHLCTIRRSMMIGFVLLKNSILTPRILLLTERSKGSRTFQTIFQIVAMYPLLSDLSGGPSGNVSLPNAFSMT